MVYDLVRTQLTSDRYDDVDGTKAKRRPVNRSTMVATIAGLLLLATFMFLLVALPSVVVDPLSDQQVSGLGEQAQLAARLDVERVRNELRIVILQATGGIVIVAGGIATWVNVTISRRRHDLDRAGQIAEQFSRAVSQLDGTQEAVRIGGIYALERIAVDSARDIDSVADVLCAIIRHRARKTAGHSRRRRSVRDPIEYLRHRNPEAQVALTVLGRMPREGTRLPLSLYDSDLRRADLRSANMSEARLSGSNLAYSLMNDALFVNARMLGFDLSGADARRADFRNAALIRATLVDTDFSNADLSGADLSNATIRKVRLGQTKYSSTTTWPQGFNPVPLGAFTDPGASRNGS
jgi:hypothetical protein